MRIGIDASRAFLKQRTGIEEYSYQVIKRLTDQLNDRQVILYVRKNQKVDFDLPKTWRIESINFPRFWTQIGLSLEMLFHPADVLFVPAHTVPLIHPAKTVVTIHGLEYEFCPKAYSLWARFYMRFSIKNSCRWARTIITVSNNTKNDLIQSYGIKENKIRVIYEGYNRNFQPEHSGQNSKFLLFIGRLEERKNIVGIIKAFEILKERYKTPHQLILAGKFGYGEKAIRRELQTVNCAKDIILTGFVSEEEKWQLLRKADVFLFPTFYEGFGIPILEAQSAGVPVVASNNSSIPEVMDGSALLVDPMNAEQIADATFKLISDESARNDIIKRGYENVKRFSWDKCAEEIAKLIKKWN